MELISILNPLGNRFLTTYTAFRNADTIVEHTLY